MLYSIIIGGIAGWLAGKLMKGGGFGLFKNIILGIIGGFVGGWIFNKLAMPFFNDLFEGIIGDLVEGVIGAVVILFIADLLNKKKTTT